MWCPIVFLIILIAFALIAMAGIIFYSSKTNIDDAQSEMEKLKITSPAFLDGEIIPDKHTCNGENVNPELDIEGIPENTQSLAIIVDDPDASSGSWVHWVVFNIPKTNKIAENSAPGEEGMNDFKATEYRGPCPPSGGNSHRYFFKIYALDTRLNLSFATKNEVELAMRGHILAKGEIVGKYKRD